MFKRTIVALSVAALTVGVAQAQTNATFTLRSGERVNAQLVDLGGTSFTVRVNGQEKRIPTGDVSVIDFGGGTMSDADWSKLSDGQHVLWLKNGDTVNGQLYDIAGTSPKKIAFRTSSGEREFSSNEIARIVLARPSNTVATSGSGNLAPATGSGISVNPRQAWTATGMTVRRGEVLTLNTTGEVQLSNDASDIANANGSKSGRRIANGPLPNGLAGALVGRIGPNGQPFGIGGATSVPMPADGQLFLGVNDDGFEDNHGEYRVEITRTGRR
jgi:hypothetical protein